MFGLKCILQIKMRLLLLWCLFFCRFCLFWGRYVRYAKQKFSSNVVEKVIKHSALESSTGQSSWTKTVVKELLASSKELISDKYGNYCLQTALDSVRDNDDLARRFLATVTPHLEGLVNIFFSFRVLFF